MIDETLFEAEEKMEKAVSVTREELGSLRTGRATPNAFARLVVDYYGSPTPIPQMASVTVPEARMAVIKPYDRGQITAVERAIRDSDLGVNPTNDGTIIRVVFPQLTEERRRDLVKVAKHKGEDGKVSIRSVRRHAKESLDRLVRDGEAGEDDVRRAEQELEKLTGRYTSAVDDLVRPRKPNCSRSDLGDGAQPHMTGTDTELAGRPARGGRHRAAGDGTGAVTVAQLRAGVPAPTAATPARPRRRRSGRRRRDATSPPRSASDCCSVRRSWPACSRCGGVSSRWSASRWPTGPGS